jgi:hypothetical protein
MTMLEARGGLLRGAARGAIGGDAGKRGRRLHPGPADPLSMAPCRLYFESWKQT